jgi:hypothetical protein
MKCLFVRRKIHPSYYIGFWMIGLLEEPTKRLIYQAKKAPEADPRAGNKLLLLVR